MLDGPFKIFKRKKRPLIRRTAKGLGEGALPGAGANNAYDLYGPTENPNLEKTSDPFVSQYGNTLNPTADQNLNQSYAPDVAASAKTVSTKKVITPDSYQIVKFEKIYYPDEDCVQIESIQIQAAIPSNPSVYSIFAMPSFSRGIIRYIGFDSNEFVDRFFTLLLNGVPVQAYSNFQGQIGTVQRPFDTFIIIPQQTTLTLSIATPSTAGANFISFRFKGWYWPLSMEGKQQIVEQYGPVEPGEEELI